MALFTEPEPPYYVPSYYTSTREVGDGDWEEYIERGRDVVNPQWYVWNNNKENARIKAQQLAAAKAEEERRRVEAQQLAIKKAEEEKYAQQMAAIAEEEKRKRQEQIDSVDNLGTQLIRLAGEDKKLQGIRKAGIALSASATIANNIQALSEASVGVAKQSR